MYADSSCAEPLFTQKTPRFRAHLLPCPFPWELHHRCHDGMLSVVWNLDLLDRFALSVESSSSTQPTRWCGYNDEGPSASKPRHDVMTSCAICLEDCSLMDRLVQTDCCNQWAHLSCLWRYYDILATSRTEYDRENVQHNQGTPNCFICRMDDHEQGCY